MITIIDERIKYDLEDHIRQNPEKIPARSRYLLVKYSNRSHEEVEVSGPTDPHWLLMLEAIKTNHEGLALNAFYGAYYDSVN